MRKDFTGRALAAIAMQTEKLANIRNLPLKSGFEVDVPAIFSAI